MTRHSTGNKEKKGFTLIELLVVIAVISLLSSIVMGSLKSARNKSAASKVEQEVRQFKNAMELYKLDHGTYYQGIVQGWTETTGSDNMTPFRNAMEPYIKTRSLSFMSGNGFHLNCINQPAYCGESTCGTAVPAADGYSALFNTNTLPSPLNLARYIYLGSDGGHYCFLND